jgi:hypothetical protein
MPAWANNRLSRMVRTGKRYLVDSSLAAAALQLDERAVLRDGDLLGRIIHTFVLAQMGLWPFRPAERIFALPVCVLWGAG